MAGHGQEPELLAEEQKTVRKLLGERYRAHVKAGAAHDAKAVGPMHALSSEVVKVCLPEGQQKPFPANCLSLMTVSGAKGSNVNFSQISCLLGQQARAPFPPFPLHCKHLPRVLPLLNAPSTVACESKRVWRALSFLFSAAMETQPHQVSREGAATVQNATIKG